MDGPNGEHWPIHREELSGTNYYRTPPFSEDIQRQKPLQ